MSETKDESARNRQEQLKTIVSDLHEGSDVKSVRRRFAELIRNVSPEEIAEMEQALIAGGVPVEQVQQVCDVHVQVFEEALGRQKKARSLPGHPVHSFVEENKAVRRILRRLRPLLGQAARGRGLRELEEALEDLSRIDIHFQRKENQLFPVLERAGFTGPAKVMWGKDDEIRAQLREVKSALRDKDLKTLKGKGAALIRGIRRMIFMEERILFPTALRRLTVRDWAEIRRGEGAIGYAWIQPGNLWDPSVVLAGGAGGDVPEARDERAGDVRPAAGAPEIPLDVGQLTGEQVNLLLKNLPVDITYVDEQDRVRYYSQGKERIFPRSPAVIGRAVQNCHPPASVHVVEKILESFKRREKDTAEFWLTLGGRFIHIRYFALFDSEDRYRGVLEVSQDLTGIRALEGERRLLDW
ncbi:MAG: DUF438 domain-containing protein [Spirochaetales bacterium]|nr:DUF438 domain-containing protein [Spirochaetales bacterium]